MERFGVTLRDRHGRQVLPPLQDRGQLGPARPGLRCPECDHVSPTPQGLSMHRRLKHGAAGALQSSTPGRLIEAALLRRTEVGMAEREFLEMVDDPEE